MQARAAAFDRADEQDTLPLARAGWSDNIAVAVCSNCGGNRAGRDFSGALEGCADSK